MIKNTHVKICCIKNIEEARIAIKSGASAIGLVGNMPGGPGIIPDETIEKIAQKVPPPIATFLLTSETSAEKIIDHYRRVNTNTIQVVDELRDGSYREIKQALPGVKLVQVIHIKNQQSIDKAIKISRNVDALLLDSGNPDKAVKELGGTGKIHNWEISKKIVKKAVCPVFLAGGLNPENVKEAIRKVRPFGVDVCSGLRKDGKLDPNRVAKFIEKVRETNIPIE